MTDKLKEDALEFMTVPDDDHNDMTTSSYVDPSAPGHNNTSVIGSWILTQSKVVVHLFYF